MLPREQSVQRSRVECPRGGTLRRNERGNRQVALADHQVDHAGEAHGLAVGRAEDVRDAVLVQRGDLLGDDHAAATAVHLDVTRAALAQEIDEVVEVLHVATLVRRDRDALDVFRDRGGHHLVDGAVVPEVHDFRALALQDPPHDVDRGVVAVEQARSGDEPDRVGGDVQRRGHAPIILQG